MRQTENTDATVKALDKEVNINFKPSAKFKYIKYLKSKFEEAEQMVHGSAETDATNELESITENATLPPKYTTTNIHPPLPSNSPPPEEPPVVLKKEIIDDDQKINKKKKVLNNPPEQPAPESKINKTKKILKKAKLTMCRNYIRGNCNKGDSCIFTHKLILSQLPSVFTFCNNFQNATCKHPKCKFLHATVFEKENFYRTGYLPQHCFSHLKDVNLKLPQSEVEASAMAGGTPPVLPGLSQQIPLHTSSPPLVVCNGSSNSVPTKSSSPPASAPPITRNSLNNSNSPPVRSSDMSIEEQIADAFSSSTLSQKRDWDISVKLSSSPCNQESSESPPKKCKFCDKIDLRYRFSKEKAERMMVSWEEMNKKIAHLTRKNSLLIAALHAYLQNCDLPDEIIRENNGISSNIDAIEKEKILVKYLRKWLLSGHDGLFGNDDSNKDLMTNAISNILDKLVKNL